MTADVPAALYQRVLRNSVRRQSDNPYRRVQFDSGAAQIVRTQQDYFIRESFTLTVNAVERQAVLDFHEAQGAGFFDYPRADFAHPISVRFNRPPLTTRQRSPGIWEVSINIEYLRSTL